MKVIKAIVDEIPETCMKCNYSYGNTCEIMFKRFTDIRFASRPDWCPLVEQNVYAVNIIQEYIRDPFENRHESDEK